MRRVRGKGAAAAVKELPQEGFVPRDFAARFQSEAFCGKPSSSELSGSAEAAATTAEATAALSAAYRLIPREATACTAAALRARLSSSCRVSLSSRWEKSSHAEPPPAVESAALGWSLFVSTEPDGGLALRGGVSVALSLSRGPPGRDALRTAACCRPCETWPKEPFSFASAESRHRRFQVGDEAPACLRLLPSSRRPLSWEQPQARASLSEEERPRKAGDAQETEVWAAAAAKTAPAPLPDKFGRAAAATPFLQRGVEAEVSAQRVEGKGPTAAAVRETSAEVSIAEWRSVGLCWWKQALFKVPRVEPRTAASASRWIALAVVVPAAGGGEFVQRENEAPRQSEAEPAFRADEAPSASEGRQTLF